MNRLACAAWTLLLAASAQAQTQRVLVSLPDCAHPSWSDAQLLDSLGLELRGEGVAELARGTSAEAADAWLAIEDACDPRSPSATLSARDARGTAARRVMSLADIPPELHTRSLALALAELWRGSWYAATPKAEPVTPPPTAEDPPEPEAAESEATPAPAEVKPPAPQPSAAAAPTLGLSVGPIVRVYFTEGSVAYGGRVAFRAFDLQLGLSLAFGTRGDPLGTLRFTVGQLFATYDLLRFEAGDYALAASPRAALGICWGSADPTSTTEAASARDLAWELGAQLALERRFGSTSLALLAASGYARGPRYEGERERVALNGVFLDGALVFGASW